MVVGGDRVRCVLQMERVSMLLARISSILCLRLVKSGKIRRTVSKLQVSDLLKTRLVLRPVATDELLRDVCVVEILERDGEPLPAQDVLMLGDNRLNALQ